MNSITDGIFYKQKFPSLLVFLRRSSAWIKVESQWRIRFEMPSLYTRQNREKTSSSIHHGLSSGMHQSLMSYRRRLPQTRFPWNKKNQLLYHQAHCWAGLSVFHLMKRVITKIWPLILPILLHHHQPCLRLCLLHAQKVKKARKKILNYQSSRHVRLLILRNLRESQRRRWRQWRRAMRSISC